MSDEGERTGQQIGNYQLTHFWGEETLPMSTWDNTFTCIPWLLLKCCMDD